MRAALTLLATAALAGCASFSPDGGLGPAQQAAKQHLGDKSCGTWLHEVAMGMHVSHG